jgi:hypothetical protein
MMSSALPPEIAQALTRGAQVVTSNQRAARTLRHAFNRAMQAAGQSRWQPPAILAFDAWAASEWQTLLLQAKADRVLLNSAQEHALWRAVLAEEDSGPAIRPLDSLAELAAEAWSRVHLYNGRARLRGLGVSTDTRAFERWAAAFDRRCQRERWLTAAQLPAALQQSGPAIPSAGLLLVGFDTPPPAYTGLFESLTPVAHFQPAVPAPAGSLADFPDETSEIRAAARWTRAVLEASPTARIAIVVPGLSARKAALARVFREVLAPGSQHLGEARAIPYEFSLGDPLAHIPLIATALDLLRWTQHALPLDTVSALLLSPFFGCSLASEATAAAEFDAFELRRLHLLRPELTLDQAIAAVEGSRRRARLSDLLARFRAMRRANASANAGATPNPLLQPHAAWADAFRTLLEAVRWTQRADSSTFQALQRWESALDELATLDFAGVPVTAADALRALERIATQTIFAPESHDAPVQIVGPLEAAGSAFDALWLLGAGELTWPPASATTPLLPWHLQHALAMPGANAARDRAASRRLTQRLAHSAATVVFSYAATIANPLWLETVRDAPPPPYPADHIARGGAQILQLQAACAFRAFAERRLFASAIDSRDPGLDPLERGSLVHKVMEAFWTGIGQQPAERNQAALQSLPPSQREALLQSAIDLALSQARHPVRTPWDEAYLNLQRQRLLQLLTPWLDFELTRPPFAVRAQEEQIEARIGPLNLKLRADRIDQTAAGGLILDYKTGPAAPSQWLGDRPDAPQLPLYALQFEPAQLGGIAFALLRAGEELSLKGFAVGPQVLANPTKAALPFAAQLKDWRRVLTGLAEDFAAGYAQVDPKRYPDTCTFCGQRLLCRLNPASFAEANSGDDAEFDPDPESEAFLG